MFAFAHAAPDKEPCGRVDWLNGGSYLLGTGEYQARIKPLIPAKNTVGFEAPRVSAAATPVVESPYVVVHQSFGSLGKNAPES